MNIFLKPFWFIYVVLIYYPLFLLTTIITATVTIIGCTLGDHKKWGFYPAMIWGRVICFITFSPVEVAGRENIVPGQSYVFAANHSSFYDVFLVYGYINRSFKWVMKEELRKVPFIGSACKAAGHIFINRKAMKQALHSIEEAKKSLTNGVSVVIFPEGTRSKNGVTGTFKRGAFKVATEMNLPIVPVSISGSHKILRKGGWFPYPGKLKMVIHQPTILHEDQAHRDEQVESIRQMVISGIVKK